MQSNRLGAMNELIAAAFSLKEYEAIPFEKNPNK